jgi:CheY-like chemotaxis protein
MYLHLQKDLWPIYILLVEDEPLIRCPVAEELRDRGFTVVEAATGDEAMAYFEATSDLDLVVTDMNMPGTLNGLELARLISLREPNLPIIIASGHVALVPSDYYTLLAKPYATMELVELIAKTLGVERRVNFTRQAGNSSG